MEVKETPASLESSTLRHLLRSILESAVAMAETNPDKVLQFLVLPTAALWGASKFSFVKCKGQVLQCPLAFFYTPLHVCDLTVLPQRHSKTAFLLICLCVLADRGVADTR